MKFVGLTALSVEISVSVPTPASIATLTSVSVPKMLFCKPSMMLCSTRGTCL